MTNHRTRRTKKRAGRVASIFRDDPRVPKEIQEAMERILDYLWDGERLDYRGILAPDRPNHIYKSLRLVRRWLDGYVAERFARRP